MKKIISAILLSISVITLFGCSNESETATSKNEATTASTVSETAALTEESVVDSNVQSETPTDDTTDVLVAYFSYSGNTRTIAEKISEEVSGDIFEIDTTYDYPEEYNEVIDIAQQEQGDNARPELSATVENIDDYDVVFLGYPNWWGDMPMVVYSFLDAYDLSGKTVVPFVTSSSSGFSNTIEAIASAEPSAVIAEGLSIKDDAIESSDEEISAWLDSLGY